MIWLNGERAERAETAALPVADRGYLLGDGLFETLLVVDGNPVFPDLHLERLYQSLPALAMPPRYGRTQILKALSDLAADMFAATGAQRNVLRLTVTRTGDRGLAMSSEADQNWLITGSPANPPPASMRVKVIDICRPASAPTSRLKSVNYLDNILARRQAVEAGADEALMVNEHGRLACAGAANIFFMRDNEILTPPIAEGALPGTRRARLLSHAQEIHDQTGLQLLEVPVTRQDLAGCNAAFLTNSLMGAVPITCIDDCAKEKSPAMQAISDCLKAD